MGADPPRRLRSALWLRCRSACATLALSALFQGQAPAWQAASHSDPSQNNPGPGPTDWSARVAQALATDSAACEQLFTELETSGAGEAAERASAWINLTLGFGERPHDPAQLRPRFEPALEHAQKLERWDAACRLSHLFAEDLLSLGQVTLARDRLRQALDPATPLGAGISKCTDPASLWAPRLALVQIERGLSNWGAALAALAELESELSRADPPDVLSKYLLGRAHGERAQIYVELGRISEARNELDLEGLAVQSHGFWLGRLANLEHEVDLRSAVADFAGARDLLDQHSESIASFPAGAQAQLGLQRGLVLANLEQSDPEQTQAALDLLSEAANSALLPLSDRARAEHLAADLHLRHGQVQAARALLESARERLEQSAAYPKLMAAQAASEARLVDQLRPPASLAKRRAVLAELQRRYIDFLDDWRAVERPPGGLGFLQLGARRSVISELVTSTLAVGRAEKTYSRSVEQALEQVLKAQACGSLSLRFAAQPPSLAELRRQLLEPQAHGMVIFVPGSDRLHVFALDREALTCEALLDYRALRESMRAFSEQLSILTSGASAAPTTRVRDRVRWLEQRGMELNQALLSGSVRELMKGWEAVTFVGLDLLEGLPIEALATAQGALLGEAFAVDSLPSVTLGTAIAARATLRATLQAGGSDLFLAGVGDPELDKSLVPTSFQFDAELAHPILAVYPESRVRSIPSQDLTAKALRAADLHDVPIVHLVAHGVYDATRIRGASLALRPEQSAGDEIHNGLFTCEDVEACSLSGLVILSACATAQGPRRLGDDDVAHLGSAFLTAGARAVILSRAKLELGWSMRSGGQLHELLYAGQSPARALQQVRQATGQTDEDPQLRWMAARLQVFGLGQRPVFKRD